MFSSLRARLVALVLVAVIPASALIVYSGLEFRQLEIAEAHATAQRLAGMVADDEEQLVENTKHILLALAQLPQIRNLDQAACNQLLAGIIKQFHSYLSIAVFTRNGDSFCSAPHDVRTINIADRKHFQQALSTRGLAMSGYVVGRLTGMPSFYIVQPVKDANGQVIATVNAGVDLGWLSDLLLRNPLPPGSTVSLFDASGKVLARYPERAKWAGKTLPETNILAAAQQHEKGTAMAEEPDGIPRLFGFQPLSIKEANAFVSVGIPHAAALAEANTMLARNLALLGLVTVLALLAAWFGGHAFVLRQVNTLLNATRRLQSGDLKARTELDGGHGELHELAQSFDGMAQALEQREAERRRAEQALRDSEERLRLAVEASRTGIWDWDMVTGMVRWTDQTAVILGLTPGETPPSFEAYRAQVHPDDRNALKQAISNALAGKLAPYLLEHRIVASDGTVRYVEARGTVYRDDTGMPVRMAGTVTDVTQRKRGEVQMRTLSAALEQTADLVFVTDVNGTIQYVNPAYEAATGFRREEVLGKNPRIVSSGMHDNACYKVMWDTILSGLPYHEVMINRRKDGTLYHEEKTITPVKDDSGKITHFVSAGKDITERMLTQERMQFLAHHDVLTGLPNRVLLHDRLAQCLAKARRQDQPVAVLFLDFDRFKIINDTLGHDMGDRVLQEFSKHLTSCVRAEDTVARLGGDEFAVVLSDIKASHEIAPVAQKILAAFSRALMVDQYELSLTTSIGISMFPRDGDTTDALLKHADSALYRAKEAGRNNFQFYSTEMGARAQERFSLESSLRHALERGEFRLDYQPQALVDTGSIVSVEALLRWQHPSKGLVLPDQFIPILEDTGLIIPVGEWVLRTACAQQKAWQDAGLEPGRIAVNLSVHQFTRAHLAETIETVVRETGTDPRGIELEITENLLLANEHPMFGALQKLAVLGVNFCIANYGTGSSSLSYLKRFPITKLKIDRSFVQELVSDSGNAAIVKAIIAMGQSLRLEIAAEGVETLEQLEFLRQQGCNAVQGYLVSPPVSADEMTRLLKKKLLLAGSNPWEMGNGKSSKQR